MTEFTTEDFKEKTSQGNVIVDFWAEWCGPCKTQGPIFSEAEKENPSVTFGKVNIDEHNELAAQNGVRSIPTLMFFKDGEVVFSHSGVMTKEAINEKVKELFS